MKRILIVEDRSTSRELLRTVLEKQGHEVTEAESGEEGLSQARLQVPDLIVLDIHLPTRDGFEICRELRQDPRLATVPIVALTASAMQGERERALISGFTGYITKPISLPKLRDEIERLLLGER